MGGNSGTLLGGLRTLPYQGGKSSFSGSGPWVAGILERACPSPTAYVEPFCGMLGVLLRRRAAPSECINDLDGRVVNFWRVIRDSPEEFVRRLMMMPIQSREEFPFHLRRANDRGLDSVDRAVATFCVLRMGFPPNLDRASFFSKMSDGHNVWNLPDDVMRLADRLRWVVLECRDGVDLVEKYKCRDRPALIYCDPPYRDTEGYRHGVDRGRFIEALLSVGGGTVMAVSGYAGEYPELEGAGWQVHHRQIRENMSKTKRDRLEGLWVSRRVQPSLSDLW